MPRTHPRQRCKQCRKHRDEVGDLSTRGYCLDCGRWRVEENILQLQARRGPFAAKHAARLIQGVASALPPLDELREEDYAPSHE